MNNVEPQVRLSLGDRLILPRFVVDRHQPTRTIT